MRVTCPKCRGDASMKKCKKCNQVFCTNEKCKPKGTGLSFRCPHCGSSETVSAN
jgi:predicted RNA-binding Zn-ribbon protein involved in translation (DUF1610 family)